MQTGAAIRRGEHRRDPSLNAKSPAQALRSAKRALYAGAAVSTVAAATVPILPLVSISATLLQVAGAYWCQRRLNQQREAIAELAKPRGFWFDDHFAPAKRGEDGSILNQGQWIADWVPFEAKQIDDVYEGTKVTRWRKVLFLEQDWKQVLDDQQSWLTTHWPAGFQAVVGWWSAHYVHRLLTWRHGAGPWTPEQEQAAGSALEADLRIGIAIAGRPHLWKRSLGMGKEAKIYRDLVRRLDEASLPKGLPAFPAKTYPILKEFFIGRGFIWDQPHRQGYEDILDKPLSDITTNPEEEGDPRYFGLGSKEATDQFLAESYWAMHGYVGGSTGCGKTSYITPILVQVIHSGRPFLLLDPKGDDKLRNRWLEEMRRVGRGHQVRYLSLTTPPDNRVFDWLATYNAFGSYGFYSELGSRVFGLMPAAKDEFWRAAGAKLAITCLGLCDSLNRLLAFLGQDRATGNRMNPASDLPPTLLMAMTFATAIQARRPQVLGPKLPEGSFPTPQQAEAAVAAILEALKDPTWAPDPATAEGAVLELLSTRSLGDVRMYAPLEWRPSLRLITEYEIDQTVPFLAWVLKIAFFHAFLADTTTSSPASPRTTSEDIILSKKQGSAGFWATYQTAGLHPLEARYQPNAQMSKTAGAWKGYFDYFCPDPASGEARDRDHEFLRETFTTLRTLISQHFSDCMKERSRFLEHATTLNAAITPLLSKARTVSALKPDVSWEMLIQENLGVYLALGAMVDNVAASALAKLLTQDLASFIGRRYEQDPTRQKPFWFICDEIYSFITDNYIDLLARARGAGLRCVAIGQTNADLAKALGSHDAAKIVKGNINTIIQLRTPQMEDAKDFAERTREVAVKTMSKSVNLTPNPGATGSKNIPEFQTSENQSFSLKTVPAVPQAVFPSLPIGQAFIFTRAQSILLAQGRWPDAKTRLLEEIGMVKEREEEVIVNNAPERRVIQCQAWEEWGDPTRLRNNITITLPTVPAAELKPSKSMAEDMTWMPAALPPPDHPAYDFLSFRSSGLNPVDPTTGTSTPTPASQPKPTTGLQEV